MPNYVHAIPLPGRPPTRRKARADAKARERALRPPVPTLRDKAVSLARARGTVTTLEFQSAGVHRCYLTPMCNEGLLVRVGRGRYRAAS